MRAVAVFVVIAAVSSGCGHLRLQKSTLRQGRTLTDLQYQQVLDNLAMFSCNPDALAWHLKLKGGLIQVTSQGTAGIAAQVLGEAELSPNAEASQAVVGQWDVDPTVEADELKALQLAYQFAVSPGSPAIAHEIFKMIGEIAVTQHIAPSREVTEALLDDFEHSQSSPEKLNDLDQLRLHLHHAYDQIEELSSRPAVQRRTIEEGEGAITNISQVEFHKQQVIGLLSSVCELPYLPIYIERRPERNVAVIEQAQDKLEALYQLVAAQAEDGTLNPFRTCWVYHGCKRDVPDCACHVGHYKGCEGERYAWVMNGNQAILRDFTLIVLRLAPADKQDISVAGRGAAFSPGIIR